MPPSPPSTLAFKISVTKAWDSEMSPFGMTSPSRRNYREEDTLSSILSNMKALHLKSGLDEPNLNRE